MIVVAAMQMNTMKLLIAHTIRAPIRRHIGSMRKEATKRTTCSYAVHDLSPLLISSCEDMSEQLDKEVCAISY